MFSRLQLISIFYTAALLLFTVYWAFNYQLFSHKKGEELFTALEVFLFVGFFYFIALQLSISRTNWLLTLFFPVIIAIVTFLITVVVLWLGSFDGNPKEDILIFGVTYTLLCATVGLVLWRKED